MSEPQEPSVSSLLPPRGVPELIFPVHVEQYWKSIEWLLLVMEGWTQLYSAADVREGMAAGNMQMWAVRDQADKMALGIIKITPASRGTICTLLLIASHFADDQSIDALIEECESSARKLGCSVLEINASPMWAQRLKGKWTAVTVERDLRGARRTN